MGMATHLSGILIGQGWTSYATILPDPVKGHLNGAYTARDGYKWLVQRQVDGECGDWNWVWRIPAPEKMRMFVWLIGHKAIPTNVLRFRRGMAQSPTCQRCSAGEEDILRCLRGLGMWCFGFHRLLG
ncbi:hypothetical protein L6164_020750 [Bauhinia variegata]|uniref:Uncharacterized protein n=1 Tax=Bauhinia variegata TaxID=167791 RepID=A0ACB9MW02_BAUVA|nr:hypothetical protein L6164_020750 [Bauhinia variegata]